MGTRWDLREAAGCLMVYAEPNSLLLRDVRCCKGVSVFLSLARKGELYWGRGRGGVG
ncbi:unnamed protein product [Staurois parvus]|uniref:Uncharacterized protein n=1 Tax=Staurois parvus TaxID=386267 RepID=A0ABN9GF80_9NEOB|nr:unnamed protein product [Staurois parvus]